MEGLIVGRRTRNIRGHALRLGVLLLLLLAGMLIMGARQDAYAASISGEKNASALSNTTYTLTGDTTIIIAPTDNKTVTSFALKGYTL
ncbi:MAG: hypothetical protein IIY82_06875, partial [Firmicutes bacterium]|nr:hypothetical protein [Bacillota bacterium]